jgi:two-component system nitrate/nitrite response regulator NarL
MEDLRSTWPEVPPAFEAGRPRSATWPAVLIASPDRQLRSQWRERLQSAAPVHEASLREDLEKAISTLAPDVVLLDLDLLRVYGNQDLAIVRRIRRRSRVVLLTASPSESEGVRALAAGARGYCSRDLDGPLLRKAVERVFDGEIWAERRLIPRVIEHYSSHPERRPEARVQGDHRLDLLTPREREIAWMIGRGASNRDIASRLMVGEGTVKAHLTAIFRKLGFSDRLQLGLFLVNPDPGSRRRH